MLLREGRGRFGRPRPADALKNLKEPEEPERKGGDMKRYVLSSLVALALVMAMSATGYSQTGHKVEANIPFDFTVSGKVLPGGTYVVTGGTLEGYLMIRNLGGGSGVLAMATYARSNTPRKEATMVFDRIGDHYFLSQIWEPGNDAGIQVPRSKRESELIKRMLARSSGGQHQAGPELVYVTGRLL
jgi:hypothetical protein